MRKWEEWFSKGYKGSFAGDKHIGSGILVIFLKCLYNLRCQILHLKFMLFIDVNYTSIKC